MFTNYYWPHPRLAGADPCSILVRAGVRGALVECENGGGGGGGGGGGSKYKN